MAEMSQALLMTIVSLASLFAMHLDCAACLTLEGCPLDQASHHCALTMSHAHGLGYMRDTGNAANRHVHFPTWHSS